LGHFGKVGAVAVFLLNLTVSGKDITRRKTNQRVLTDNILTIFVLTEN
jgi:hypothetical protein